MSSFDQAWQLLKKDNPLFPERDDEIREVVDANMAEKKKANRNYPNVKINPETGGPENASIRALLDRARGVPRKPATKPKETKLPTDTLNALHSKVKKNSDEPFDTVWLIVKQEFLEDEPYSLYSLISDIPSRKKDRSVFNFLSDTPEGQKIVTDLMDMPFDYPLEGYGLDLPKYEYGTFTKPQEFKRLIGGGFSKTKKMPGGSFSMPTHMCRVGGKLREVPGTVCHNCYVHGRGQGYPMNASQRHLLRNYAAMKMGEDPAAWASNIAQEIPYQTKNFPLMRFFDSGDVDSPEMMSALMDIALQNPDIFHWIPTRERSSVARAMSARDEDTIPKNMSVMVSLPFINQTLDNDLNVERGVPKISQKFIDLVDRYPQLQYSNVIDNKEYMSPQSTCLASVNPGSSCVDHQCSDCFDPNVVRNENGVKVGYYKH